MSNLDQLVGPYERLILLKTVALSDCPPATALGALARQAEERHFDAGVRITGSPWNSAHVVVEGRVSVYQAGQPVFSAGPKEAFGVLEALARPETDFEARADADTLTLEISATTFLSVLEDHHGMTQGTIQALGRTLLETPSWLVTTMERRMPVPDRVPRENLDLVNRIRMLQVSGVFAHARVDSLAEIASHFEEFHAQPGSVLWREGDPADWFVVLLDGRIDSSSALALHFSWTPGMIPGFFEALATTRRWHNAIAATRVTGLRFSAERLFDALEDDFAMAADLLSALTARVCHQRQALRGPQQLAHDT